MDDDTTAGRAPGRAGSGGAAVAQPRVPRQRGPVEDHLPRDAGDGPLPAWPAADHFADRSGLTATQARLLLAVFCGTAPDHAEDAPSR